jgi:hypothetical protein
MSKNVTLVLFKEGHIPRIYKNGDLEALKKQGEVLIDPKLPKGIPPHLWELKEGKIVPGKDKALNNKQARKAVKAKKQIEREEAQALEKKIKVIVDKEEDKSKALFYIQLCLNALFLAAISLQYKKDLLNLIGKLYE